MGAVEDTENPVSCSDSKTEDIQRKFQSCSHMAVTSFYEDFENITDTNFLPIRFCQTLNTIGSVCVSHLSECFAAEDIIQMKQSHMAEMRTFLLRITRGKLGEEDTPDCEEDIITCLLYTSDAADE